MNKRSIKLVAAFSLVVFLIIIITMIFIGCIIFILSRLNIIKPGQSPEILFLIFAIVSVVIGTLIGRISTKKMIAPIIEISEATKEVAKGNFDIKLSTKSHAHEVNIMAQNFMLMAQELANTETFHNDFIQNVSHEFKTPISAIEGYATLLQSKTLSPEKTQTYVSKILFNTKRLSTMTGNILELARLENQEITTEKKFFSLDEQIREEILLFERTWSDKNVELDIELEAVDYFGNSDLLSQVWQNLIGNAIKYVKTGGIIRIILKKDDDKIKVFVSDNGAGMDEATKERIFEKFYQGDTSHSSDGNGLGLTLAKRIIDLHGGTIEVSSKKGKGSTFIVTL